MFIFFEGFPYILIHIANIYIGDIISMMFSRCQYEFKKDYMEDLDKQKYEDDLSKAESDDEKKNITAEFEAQEMKLRRRSLGNIRFIGKIRDLDII